MRVFQAWWWSYKVAPWLPFQGLPPLDYLRLIADRLRFILRGSPWPDPPVKGPKRFLRVPLDFGYAKGTAVDFAHPQSVLTFKRKP
jgi:hypothetical protein